MTTKFGSVVEQWWENLSAMLFAHALRGRGWHSRGWIEVIQKWVGGKCIHAERKPDPEVRRIKTIFLTITLELLAYGLSRSSTSQSSDVKLEFVLSKTFFHQQYYLPFLTISNPSVKWTTGRWSEKTHSRQKIDKEGGGGS